MNSTLGSFGLRWRTGFPLLNWLGSRFGKVRPLDVDWLIARAQQQTGFSDWGEPDVREPLKVLVDSYEGSGQLTPMGRRLLRGVLTGILIKRLRIVQKFVEEPEVMDRDISKPVFIIGMPRSGTTLLYNLLALDPRFRPLKIWETFNPVDGKPAGGFKKAVGRFFMKLFYPAFDVIHPRSPLQIEESTRMLANSLYTPGFFSLFGEAGSYEEWLLQQQDGVIESAYQLYRNQLKNLQGEHDSQRWLLKSPAHSPHLEILMRT